MIPLSTLRPPARSRPGVELEPRHLDVVRYPDDYRIELIELL